MEGKIDKTIVKSILAAFGIIVVICIVLGIIINIINKENTKSQENTAARAACINEGKCFINGECVECDSKYVENSETAKKGAAESRALGYIDAVEKQVMLAEVEEDAESIDEGIYTVKQLFDLGVEVYDKKPYSSGIVKINRIGAVEEATLEYDDYNVYYDGRKAIASDK